MRVSRSLIVSAAALAVGLAVAGCGEDDFPNDPRPPSPVSLAALITDDVVSVSPRKPGAIGAGPARFTIDNQSGEPGALVLEGPTDAASAEILPGNTGELSTELLEGEYIVSADEGSTASDTTLSIGPERPSARNELLLP